MLFPDKLADEIELDLFTFFTVSSVSVILVDLDLSNDLPLSDLLLLHVSNFLDACYFSVLLTVSILSFAIGVVIAYLTTLGFFPCQYSLL